MFIRDTVEQHILARLLIGHFWRRLFQGQKGDSGDRYVQVSDNNSLVTFAEGPQGLPGPPGPPGISGLPGRKVYNQKLVSVTVIITVIIIIVYSRSDEMCEGMNLFDHIHTHKRDLTSIRWSV